MALEMIRKGDTKDAFKRQLVRLVVDRRKHSEKHYETDRRAFPDLYDLYRGVLTGRFQPHKNNIHIPLIFATIQSDVARKAQNTFGENPVVEFVGFGPDDAGIARKRGALVNAQLEDARSFEKGVDAFLTADLYGKVVVQHGWKTDLQEMVVPEATILPSSGRIVEQITRKTVTQYDGPDWEVIDPLDCHPQPGFSRISDSDWFIVRRFLDLDAIRALAEQGIFDAAEVRRLEREGSGTSATDNYKAWRSAYRSEGEEMARNAEPLARPIEILEFWGKIPSELAVEGTTDVVLTVANDNFLLRGRPNPFWHGQKPFFDYAPTPDPHYFWPVGKAAIAKRLQIVANRFTNQVLDALDLFIDPAFFYDKNTNLETRNLYLRPGRFIPVDGNPGQTIMPVQADLRGVEAGMTATETVWRWIQLGTGLYEDTGLGGSSSTDQTARGFLGRQEALASRLLLEMRVAEKTFIEPLANMFVALDKQFLTTPKEILILGESAQIDPITGEPLPNVTRESVDALDLVPNYAARARGASSRVNRATRQQNIVLLMQAAAANPIVAQHVNWLNFFRQAFTEFEFTNINELIASAPEAQGQLQQAAQGQVQRAAGSAPGVPGAPENVQPESGGLASIIGSMSPGS